MPPKASSPEAGQKKRPTANLKHEEAIAVAQASEYGVTVSDQLRAGLNIMRTLALYGVRNQLKIILPDGDNNLILVLPFDLTAMYGPAVGEGEADATDTESRPPTIL